MVDAQATAPKTPTEKPKATPEIKTCAACSKPLKKVKRYYRNGKYYCNKNCWKTLPAKSESSGPAVSSLGKQAEQKKALAEKG